MPQDSLVWIVLIVAAALVIGLTVWKGRGLRLKRGQDGFSVRVEQSRDSIPNGETTGEGGRISVAEGARIERARVGDLAGIKSAGRLKSTSQNIEVAAGARIKNAEVGDIVGVKQSTPPPQDEP
jgi:hypothetical protein